MPQLRRPRNYNLLGEHYVLVHTRVLLHPADDDGVGGGGGAADETLQVLRVLHCKRH